MIRLTQCLTRVLTVCMSFSTSETPMTLTPLQELTPAEEHHVFRNNRCLDIMREITEPSCRVYTSSQMLTSTTK